MGSGLTRTTGVVKWGCATHTLLGETECGDRHLVAPVSDGVVVAVVDGVGHGHEAAIAADCVVDTIRAHAENEPLVELVQRCHANLHGMRGAAMSLAIIDQAGVMSWIGVGDVEGRLLRNNEIGAPRQDSLLLRSGVVGERLPPLDTISFSLSRFDTLIFATDGIDRDFSDSIAISGDPQQIADEIIQRYSKRTDDALVLVARYDG